MADATTLRILGDLVQPGDTVHALDRMKKRSGLMNTVDLFFFGIFTDAERFSNLGRRWVLVSQGNGPPWCRSRVSPWWTPPRWPTGTPPGADCSRPSSTGSIATGSCIR